MFQISQRETCHMLKKNQCVLRVYWQKDSIINEEEGHALYTYE